MLVHHEFAGHNARGVGTAGRLDMAASEALFPHFILWQRMPRSTSPGIFYNQRSFAWPQLGEEAYCWDLLCRAIEDLACNC